MIINDFNLKSVVCSPHDANEVLVVDPNTVLPMPLAAQFFQAVPRRSREIVEFRCGIKHGQLATRRSGERVAASLASSPDFHRLFIGETPDHSFDNNARR